ncbi:ATP-binding protein [Amycolatopsis balhimycina DSM 5908]|uniref:ATP-binding protein n=1 Tax=Amycolatopsis balhimycina DSM 5908 TaxID=1081091 RepID=A0A428W690_AMYBA|nr:ATP-binding protein [Amycolatopsis balhimycina]RSM38474.1 ATP-binding protein [Amycolatopsis balhimycina DSM 5908]
MVETDHSGSVLLTRRLLWNGVDAKPPPPVVLLLGPVGAGKSHALEEIGDHLSWGVVHARFDFAGDEPTPVDVLTRLTYNLSRKWPHRARPRFLRFTVALIAVGAELTTTDRVQDKETLRRLLVEFKRSRWSGRLDPLVRVLVKTAASAVPAHLGDAFAAEVPTLIQTIRPRLGQVLRSLTEFDRFKSGDALDALVDLNWLARGNEPDPDGVTAWLTEAFLADVRENHRRMSAPERRSPCDCESPGKHVHNWVVLLDDVDRPGGLAFLKALAAARETHRRRHGDRGTGDPLLVVATSGKWDGEWERELARAWRPPWQPDRGTARVVPNCRNASYDGWAKVPENARPSGYYPVLLEPLDVDEVAAVLSEHEGEDVPRATAAFVRRATGGLPMAVRQLARTLDGTPVRDGARDVLGTSGPDPWRSWLTRLGLSTVDTEALVTAAPFATAPWLVPLTEHGLVGQPNVGTILTELRSSLWVSAPDTGGGTPDHATLHPWLAGNLVSALARRNGGAGPTYEAQFTALSTGPGSDDVRRAYCRLALGDFPAVVDLFEQDFPKLPHQDWIDRLTVVVHAPDAQPLEEDYERLYGKLVGSDVKQNPGDRTEIRNNLARLIAASWLTANPFAVRGPDQNRAIGNALVALSSQSQRADTKALDETAKLAYQGLWP